MATIGAHNSVVKEPKDPNNPDVKKRCCTRIRKKGDRGFIEGCLFALCCCWLCDACFDVSVVAG